MLAQNGENAAIYEFDGYRLDSAKRLLYGADGRPLPLKPKAFETLLFLLENPGRVIERDEIMDAVWLGTVVEENNLTQHISSLRRLLGEAKNDHRYIVTVPGRGYEFAANVTRRDGNNGRSDRHSTDPTLSSSRTWLIGLAAGTAVLLLLLAFLYPGERSLTANTTIKSIAVLPFQPVSEVDRDQRYELGMTDELITKLASSYALTVRSFQAVKRFASDERDPIAAGRELQVDAVLEGSTQFAADKVRVSVRLLRVADSKQLWEGSFSQERKHVFEIQEEIAKRVASELMVRLSENALKRHTDNPEAYELYLKGRFHLLRLKPDEVRQGIASFRQAVDIDPNYALAYAGIARAYMSFVLSSELPPGEMIEQSLAAAEKAVQLDPQLAEAHATLGAVYFWFKHDWAASETAFKTALDLDPRSAFAHLYYAVLLGNLGRTAESLQEAEMARTLDPFLAYAWSIQGTILVHAGKPEEALTRYGEAARLDPGLWIAHCKSALALIELHRYDEALASAKKAFEMNGSQTNSVAYESFVLAKLGRRGEAEKKLDGLLKQANVGYVPPYYIAIAYIGLDDRENALKWLERGVADKDPRMVWLRSEHFWNELRTDPRFIELIRKMNLDG